MLTIGKLAARVGISTEALRYYEQEKLIVPNAKSGAGYRLYHPDSLTRIRFIRQAQQCGFTIAEVRELLVLQSGASARLQCWKLPQRSSASAGARGQSWREKHLPRQQRPWQQCQPSKQQDRSKSLAVMVRVNHAKC